jgi:pimeloyl-ACP methyl ester carboxylesterase
MAAPHEQGEVIASRRGFFWVGVDERIETPVGHTNRGQMYVEWEAPETVTQPCPIILVHGGGGQGTDYLGTPDGRPGWAPQLVQEGWAVYVVDRPGHGRAPLHPDVLGPMGPPFSYEFANGLFGGGTQGPMAYPPGIESHTQWPGSGEMGDPVMDQLLAGTGPMLVDMKMAHAIEQDRLAKLLDIVGPSVLVSHSAGGPAGWLAAEARPDLIRALVQIEVLGPPFLNNPDMGVSLDWGPTDVPLAYDPPVSDPAELKDGTPRKLVNLSKFPIALMTSESSVFTQIDPHTYEYMKACGCDIDYLELPKLGVRGNGHGMMLEKNNREALQPILDWLASRL